MMPIIPLNDKEIFRLTPVAHSSIMRLILRLEGIEAPMMELQMHIDNF
jgi:hypothetical protein